MGSKKLLVADDSLTIQKVIRLALANEGYEIQAISDGNDAVQHISLFQPDLVLIDVSLPGKTAFEVKRAVNQEPDLANTRFVLMSSAFERVDEAQAAEVSFHGRLTKPFDPGHLREVLQQVFAQNPSRPRPAGAQYIPPPPNSPVEVAPKNPFETSGVPVSVDDPAEELPLAKPPIPVTPSFTPPPIPQPPIPELPAATSSTSEDKNADIRELTESTIRMTGLNDFEWSVQEPSLKPPRSFMEQDDISNSSLQYFKNPTPVQETSSVGPAPTEQELKTPPPYDLDSITGNSPAPSAPAVTVQTETVRMAEPDPKMIEELVARRVEEALQKTIQQMLPDLAEKLIKEQIRQMLSEQP